MSCMNRIAFGSKRNCCYLQCSQHVAGADDVDADTCMGPFDGQTRGQMADGCLGCVVGCLRLRDVDDGPGHGSDHDDAALCVSLHQVTGDAGCEQVGPVDVDAPEFLDSIERISDCVEVLGEAGGCDQMVDFAVVLDDFGDRGVD